MPSALESAAAKVLQAVADTMPVLAFGALGLAATRSSVRVGVGKLLEQSDTLVVAGIAAMGWGVNKYVEHVDARFDVADKVEKERFAAADNTVKERFSATDKRLDSLKQSVDKLVEAPPRRRF